MRRLPSCRLLLAVVVSCLGAAPQRAQSRSDAPDPGRQHFAAGDYGAAEAAFSRDLAAGRNDASLYYNRALARFNQQNYRGARTDLDAYLALAPRAAAALAFRANVALLLGDPAGAVADADAALESAPDDLDTLLVRGQARLALGRTDAAFADFARALERAPRHPAALVGRGDVQLARGRLPEAQEDFARAASLAPQDPDAHYKLGLAQFRQLNFAAAVPNLETAGRLAPESSLVARALGCAQYAAGDFARAAQTLQRAVALDPADTPYARLLLHLAQRRGDQPVAAAPADGPAPATTVPSDWPGLLLRYVRGEATEDDLLLGAQNLAPASARAGRWCEAHYYLGSMRLLAKDTRGARYAFQEALATGQTAFTEHTLARAELDRLVDLPEPPKPRPSRRH